MAPAASFSELSTLRRYGVLVTLTAATALVAMTVTVANTSLPQIQGSLSATQDQIALVVTFNLVATAIGTPATGWLAARFGRRRVMIAGVVGFTLATLLCGLSHSLVELMVWRIGQGLFGAPLIPLGQAIILASFPQRQHGMVTAVFGLGVCVGPIVALLGGGYLSELYNWRWVFFMMVPGGVACLAGVLVFVRGRDPATEARLDWTGFLALSVAIAAFQFMLDRGERNDWFASTEIVVEAVVAAVAFWIFCAHVLTANRPFLNPRLLLDRNYAVGLLLTLVFGALNFSPMTLLPPLLQNLQGYPDSVIGFLLAMRGVGTFLGFMVMMFANRTDPRPWLYLGFGVQAVAGWQMAQFDINVTTWEVATSSLLQGLGVGLLWVPLTLITFRTLDPAFLPEGTAVFHLMRNMGSSIHISLSVALALRMGKVNYADMTEHVSPYNEALLYPWVMGGFSTESARGLATLGREVQRQAAMIGYIDAFYFYAATAVVALPLILLVRWRKQRPGGA
jgi:MFS transporter, DHA2 family, multidrug resistance protein